METYVAQWDFEGKEEGEIHFNAGDRIVVVKKDETGWWSGYVDNGDDGGEHEIGMFPGDYVVPAGDDGDDDGDSTSLASDASPATEQSEAKSVHYIVTHYVYDKTGFKKRTLSIPEYNVVGGFKKTKVYHVVDVNDPIEFYFDQSMENIKWYIGSLREIYPTIAVPNIPDVKQRSDILGYKTKDEVTIKSLSIVLNRIWQHPVLSQSKLSSELVRSKSLKDFKAVKKRFNSKRAAFYQSIEGSEELGDPLNDPGSYTDVVYLMNNLKQHEKEVDSLWSALDEYVVKCSAEETEVLEKISQGFEEWADIGFDWRDDIPTGCAKSNDGIKEILKLVSKSLKRTAQKLDGKRVTNYNLLYTFYADYLEMGKALDGPLRYYLSVRSDMAHANRKRIKIELKSMKSDDREKLSKAEENEKRLKEQEAKIRRALHAESDLFRVSRYSLVKETLTRFLEEEIEYRKYVQGKYKGIVQMLDSFVINHGFDD